MTTFSFILSSARHYAKAHLGLLFGVFLASAILSGSLLVGDSVKASLRRVAELRLGKVRSGMVGGERWFTEELARKTGSVPLALASGSVSAATGTARVNAAQVLSVDDTFWNLSPSGKKLIINSGEVLLNESMANKLQAKVGDSVIVRIEKPSALSRDAPMSGSTNSDIALRRKVTGIVSAEDFGAFQLQASQIGADTVFVGLKDLQGQIELGGKCNASLANRNDEMLIGEETVETRDLAGHVLKVTKRPMTDAEMLGIRMSREATLADYALNLKRVKTDKPEWEIITDRVFLDETIAAKLTKTLPKAEGVLTYLVNGLSSKSGATPYSMVTSSTGILPVPSAGGILPPDAAGKMPAAPDTGKMPVLLATQWLADDLGLKLGDKVDLRYFAVGIGRELKEQTAGFTVSGILPMNDPRLTKDWTPSFPGVSDVDNCRDWDPGFPMDKKAIRDKDEKYWDEFKGTPKAFISLEAGQKLWGNRFGKLTAIRFADTGQNEDELKNEIVKQLSLEDIGLTVQDFKSQADSAAKGSVDFGGLFAGLSMFLIAAALVFAALLFVFLIERRASQAGLLMAVGWTPKMVRRALLLEAGVIALIGSALGLLGGVAYTKAALAGLGGAWGGATAGLPLMFDAQPVTLIIAFVASFGIAMLTLWWMTRRLLKSQPRELLSNSGIPAPFPSAKTQSSKTLIIAGVCLIGTITLVVIGRKLTNPEELAGSFFGAGMLLMTAALALAKRWMNIQSRSTSIANSLTQIGLRNITRRPGRSLAILGMMAGGIFLVVAVNAFRLSADSDATKRDSGTGGFALVGESSLPVYEDLNTKTGREAFGLDEEDLHGATILPFRARPGDDASCLNLNRAQNPQLVGVNTAKLADLHAFSFASGSWQNLKSEISDLKSEIPAACDQATAMWGLQKGVGDVIEYDLGGEKKLRVKLVALLAGSVLQGKVIIDERAFLDHLPDVSGYRFFLVDAAPDKAKEVSETLTKQLQPRGLALEPTTQRLNAFSAVQNTYIGIFTVLGGLGVLLGTAGIGVLVMRHVMERRGELGLMQAVGFLPAALRRMIVGEHGALLVGGVVIGVISAAVAVWPSLASSAQDLPVRFVAGLVVAILLCGLAVCATAAALALRGRLTDSLRNE